MQSYRENSTNSTLDPLPSGPSSSLNAGAELSKYSARYEEAMNPFEAFRGRVSSASPIVFLRWRAECVIHITGSSACIFSSQSAGARRFGPYSGDIG